MPKRARLEILWLSFSHPQWRCLHESGLFRLLGSPWGDKVPPRTLKQKSKVEQELKTFVSTTCRNDG